MKKILMAAVIGVMLVSSLGFGSGKINGKHSGKKGKDAVAVNCAYCHDAKKANLPKTKGQDLAAAKTGVYCKMSGCH